MSMKQLHNKPRHWWTPDPTPGNGMPRGYEQWDSFESWLQKMQWCSQGDCSAERWLFVGIGQTLWIINLEWLTIFPEVLKKCLRNIVIGEVVSFVENLLPCDWHRVDIMFQKCYDQMFVCLRDLMLRSDVLQNDFCSRTYLTSHRLQHWYPSVNLQIDFKGEMKQLMRYRVIVYKCQRFPSTESSELIFSQRMFLLWRHWDKGYNIVVSFNKTWI